MPPASRVAPPPEGYQFGARKRRASGNATLNQPYGHRVSTDRLSREDSYLAAFLEGEPGPTPAGKIFPHSYPETRFRRERARGVRRSTGHIMMTTRYSNHQGFKSRQNPCQVQPTEDIGNISASTRCLWVQTTVIFYSLERCQFFRIRIMTSYGEILSSVLVIQQSHQK